MIRICNGVPRSSAWSPVFGVFLLAFTGCGSLPKPRPEWSVRHPVDTENTAWARTVAPAAVQHPGSSGIELLAYGLDALAARLALADTAERTLSLQYYIWTPDTAGRLLTEHVLSAADRGVRVRILLDDIGGSTSDDVLLALSSHTNIQVRIFNPIANRTFRKLSLLFNLSRVGRRMHNKSFTADGSVTILGGRNIGDRYFALGEEPRFVDFEVIAAGPAVTEVSAMFERFWYSPLAIPIQAMVHKHVPAMQMAEIRAGIAAQAQVDGITNAQAVLNSLAGNDMGAALRRHNLDLVWGPARLVSDRPEKVTTDPSDTSTHLLPKLNDVMNGTMREMIIVSPYFVPGENGVEFFRSLRERGVRVVVLSNSLAANDVTAVHAGYRRYRKPLLLAGVELWEMKPNVNIRGTKRQPTAIRHQSKDKQPGSSLHTKAFIFDRQTLFVGSLNLTPRSASLNTEMGLIMDIPKLAAPAADTLEQELEQNAYHLRFVPGPGPCKECGHIEWLTHENGQAVRYTHEPYATFSQLLTVCLLSFLPIESQL